MTSVAFADTEKRMRALLVKDFNLDPGGLTRDARLDELGVDSIGMAELIFNVEDELGLKLPDVAVQLSTFGEVVEFIDEAAADQRASAAPSPLGASCARLYMRRVAVTGIGLVSPLGHDANSVFGAARIGRSCVRRLHIAGSHRLAAPLAAMVEFDATLTTSGAEGVPGNRAAREPGCRPTITCGIARLLCQHELASVLSRGYRLVSRHDGVTR